MPLPRHRFDNPVRSVCEYVDGTVFIVTDGSDTGRLAGTDRVDLKRRAVSPLAVLLGVGREAGERRCWKLLAGLGARRL